MNLFDYLFPDVAQASHLRRIADEAETANIRSRIHQAGNHRQQRYNNRRIEELEVDVAQLTLVVEALIGKLVEGGNTTREELAARIAEIDLRDGVADGRFTTTTAPNPPSPKSGVQFNSPG